MNRRAPTIEFAFLSGGRLAAVLRVLAMFAVAVVVTGAAGSAVSQESPAEQRADEMLVEPADDIEPSLADDGTLAVPMLQLVIKGGWLMVPIGVMSIIVVAIGLSARSDCEGRGSFHDRSSIASERWSIVTTSIRDRRTACANIFLPRRRVSSGAMLLKVGRPLNEVEHTVIEACQRETDRLYSRVRTLNLAAAITPLLGLLGTVWGMIRSFFVTANLPVGSNKAEALAEGIYVALVTTFAGLAVAIPAAVLAHYFEGRILGLVREIEKLVGSLLPQVERFEGKLRIDEKSLAQTRDDNHVVDRPEMKASQLTV